jgi:ArsR family metal-binding transcriptional regulator
MKIITIEPCYTRADEDLFSGEAELGSIMIIPETLEKLRKHFDDVQVTADNEMLILTNYPVEKIIVFDTGRTIIRRIAGKNLAMRRLEQLEKILLR